LAIVKTLVGGDRLICTDMRCPWLEQNRTFETRTPPWMARRRDDRVPLQPWLKHGCSRLVHRHGRQGAVMAKRDTQKVC